MYQLLLGKISDLSAHYLPPEISQSAPEGVRRLRWLAGRVLLSRVFPQLPEITYGPHGKPAFCDGTSFWFNFSHSGDDIALFLSDEGEVGCDIEVIRPRNNWRDLAREVFSVSELDEMNAQSPEMQLTSFWQIWTRKEAIIKQHGGSVWQMAKLDSTASVFRHKVSHRQFGHLSIAVCTPTAYVFPEEDLRQVKRAAFLE